MLTLAETFCVIALADTSGSCAWAGGNAPAPGNNSNNSNNSPIHTNSPDITLNPLFRIVITGCVIAREPPQTE
jgi:hypothetical protein